MTPLRLSIATAVLLAVAQSARPADPDPQVRKLAEIAKEIKTFLAEETAVNLGAFTGPNLTKNAGPGFAQKLTVELRRASVTVKTTGAKHTLKGEYTYIDIAPAIATGRKKAVADLTNAEKNAPPLMALRVEFKITDVRGKALRVLTQDIVDEQTILESVGASVELPPTSDAAPNPIRDKVIRTQVLDTPKPPIKQGKAESSKGTFGMEILVGGKQRPVADQDGIGMVKLQRGEKYVVRLVNNHKDLDMAATLCIDGINVFQFSEVRDPMDAERPKYSYYIVPKNSSVDIVGWHRNMESANEFEIGGFGESAAAKVAMKADEYGTIGMITASFAAAWPKDQNPPKDETATTKSVTADATKIGELVPFPNKAVERVTGTVRGVVTVRYSKPEKQ